MEGMAHNETTLPELHTPKNAGMLVVVLPFCGLVISFESRIDYAQREQAVQVPAQLLGCHDGRLSCINWNEDQLFLKAKR